MVEAGFPVKRESEEPVRTSDNSIVTPPASVIDVKEQKQDA